MVLRRRGYEGSYLELKKMRKDKTKKRIFLIVSTVLLACLWPASVVRADEINELKQQLLELQNRINRLEERQKEKER